MNLKSKFKRMLSGVLSLDATVSILQCFPAFADEQTEPEKYPYTRFEASDSEERSSNLKNTYQKTCTQENLLFKE